MYAIFAVLKQREIILLAIIAGLLFWLFFRTEPGQAGQTIIEHKIEWQPVSVEIPVPEPSRTTIIERTIPAESIPDSLIRRLYNELAAKYDTLNQIREYEKEIEDSNATGTIRATVKGRLLEWGLDYQIKPVTLRDTVKFNDDKLRIFGTTGIGTDFQPSIGLMAERGKWLIGADYKPMNQAGSIKVGFRLFRIKSI